MIMMITKQICMRGKQHLHLQEELNFRWQGREAATAASEDERQLSEARVRLYMLQQICNSGPTAGGLTRGTLGQVLQGTVEKNIRNGM